MLFEMDTMASQKVTLHRNSRAHLLARTFLCLIFFFSFELAESRRVTQRGRHSEKASTKLVATRNSNKGVLHGLSPAWGQVYPSQTLLQATLQQGYSDPGLLWSQCEEVASLGEVCVGVYGDPTAVPATVGVEMTLMNRTFLLPVLGAQACLNDQILLALLTKGDPLKHCPTCQALAQLEKILGSQAVSLCVLFTDTFVDISEARQVQFGACSQLQAKLGCFHSRCMIKRRKHMGCFNIHLPHKKSRIAVD